MELKHKIKEIVLALDALRRTGEAVSLRQYVAEQFPGKSVEHLYAECDINPARTTLEQLMADEETAYLASAFMVDAIRIGMGLAARQQMAEMRERAVSQAVTTDPAARFITPEVILDAVSRGSVEAVFYSDLTMAEIPVSNPQTATMPRIQLSNAKPKRTRQMSKIEVGTVIYDSKEVKINDYALGIEASYQAMKFNTLDLIAIFFIDLGRRLGAMLNDEITLVSLNGDQADLSESSAVIGVSVVGELAYKDITRPMIRMRRLGCAPGALLASEDLSNDWLNLAEVKGYLQGAALIRTNRTPIPAALDLFTGSVLPATQLQLIDSSMAFVQLIAQALMMETEKIVSKRMEGTYASIMTAFANVQRKARVTIDTSIQFNANQWPDFMTLQ
jgi:hypothetical protein